MVIDNKELISPEGRIPENYTFRSNRICPQQPLKIVKPFTNNVEKWPSMP